MRKLCLIALFVATALAGQATEFHVAMNGNDSQAGTRAGPLRTIQRAAELAQPGDSITVHAGVYRERVNPPRGGTSATQRIVYQAAPGERVEIKGSEVVKGWVNVQPGVWRVVLPNSFFGRFNPYGDLIHGDWFDPRGREHHTGSVYLNGDWLTEAARLEDVLGPVGKTPLWFGRVDQTNTTLWAQFNDADPNQQLVEINVRQTVFYPARPGRDYITVRGFDLSQAATPWAPPTAEQMGVLGTHWSKGWVIESNEVSFSTCCGIALGKYGDPYDNTSANTAEGYVKTIERALKHAWNKQTIGHHLVRHNTVSHCEQAGIVGSLGAAFSTVSGNVIHDIHVRGLFSGAEMAGIKFHGAIDTVIRGNHIYRTCLGLWLDWMAQGTQVSGNLFHDNAGEDLFMEVDHGPFVVDNNLFLSGTSLLDMSEGGAYAHNLFAGKIVSRPELSRSTPYHSPHSTAVAGLSDIQGGDDRFYNNIFIGNGPAASPLVQAKAPSAWDSGYGLAVYNARKFPLQTGGNVYYNGARPYAKERGTLIVDRDPKARLTERNHHLLLQLSFGNELRRDGTMLVTTALLGRARVPGLPYENADGSPLRLDTDYFGAKRDATHPFPGPFESGATAGQALTVW
jgi:alpha-L-arabinofuranosidase